MAGRVIEKINKVNKNKSQNGELHLLDISVCNTAQHKHSTGAVKEKWIMFYHSSCRKDQFSTVLILKFNFYFLLFIFADQVFIDPTFSGIFVCGPLQSFVVNVCNFYLVFRCWLLVSLVKIVIFRPFHIYAVREFAIFSLSQGTCLCFFPMAGHLNPFSRPWWAQFVLMNPLAPP